MIAAMSMTRQDIQDLMLDYLYEELSSDETTLFEEALGQHPDLQQEVEAHRGTRAAFSRLPDIEVPHLVQANILREARKAVADRTEASQPAVGWFSQLVALLTRPAMATALVAVLVAVVGLYVVDRGVLSPKKETRDDLYRPPAELTAAEPSAEARKMAAEAPAVETTAELPSGVVPEDEAPAAEPAAAVATETPTVTRRGFESLSDDRDEWANKGAPSANEESGEKDRGVADGTRASKREETGGEGAKAGPAKGEGRVVDDVAEKPIEKAPMKNLASTGANKSAKVQKSSKLNISKSAEAPSAPRLAYKPDASPKAAETDGWLGGDNRSQAVGGALANDRDAKQAQMVRPQAAVAAEAEKSVDQSVGLSNGAAGSSLDAALSPVPTPGFAGNVEQRPGARSGDTNAIRNGFAGMDKANQLEGTTHAPAPEVAAAATPTPFPSQQQQMRERRTNDVVYGPSNALDSETQTAIGDDGGGAAEELAQQVAAADLPEELAKEEQKKSAADASSLMRSGDQLLAKGDVNGAVSAYERAAQEDGSLAALAKHKTAKAYRRANRFLDALVSYDGLLSNYPRYQNRTVALKEKFEVSLALNQLDKAERTLKEMETLPGGEEQAKSLRQRLYATRVKLEREAEQRQAAQKRATQKKAKAAAGKASTLETNAPATDEAAEPLPVSK